VNRIRRRLALAAGTGRGRTRGYATRAERFEKQRRLQVLECRLAEAERRIADGRVSVCRGGRRLARTWHHREEAGLTEAGWRERWEVARLFITADGETDKAWGQDLGIEAACRGRGRGRRPRPQLAGLTHSWVVTALTSV
jgi:hypothetical protein